MAVARGTTEARGQGPELHPRLEAFGIERSHPRCEEQITTDAPALRGVALGVSPFAAWFAVDGAFSARLYAPLVLGLAVAAWVAGFDVLYACQDDQFDRARGLRSLPVALGRRGAMWGSRALHAVALAGFVLFGLMTPLGAGYAVGVLLAAGLLVWQHRLLRPDDLSRIQAAFFTANGALAVVLFAAGCLDLYL